MNAFILVRLVCEALAVLVAFVGGLILAGIGRGQDALSLVIVCGIVAWFVRPDDEQREQFRKFQESREKFPTR